MDRILVGTDGSETATRAVERAAQIAEATGAELIVFTAYQPPRGGPSARKILGPVMRKLKGRVNARALAREGNAADAILEIAEEENVDLIVVGNKGMTGARRYFLGSVPNRVSHNIACNLLIVKTT